MFPNACVSCHTCQCDSTSASPGRRERALKLALTASKRARQGDNQTRGRLAGMPSEEEAAAKAAQEMRAAKLPRPSAGRAGTLRLTVEAATHPALVIAAMPSDTLARLRARIDAACGMPPELQRVRAGGQQLEEGPRTLEQRGIGSQTALSVITREAEVEQLLAEESACRQAVAAAEARVAESEASVAGVAVGKRWITEPMRLRLYREDGSVKHWRWFKLTRESRIDRVGCDYFVSWGKEEDGREHMLWKKCGLAPPKIVKLSAVRAVEQPRRLWPGGFVLDADNRPPLLVASADASTQAAWNTALRAVVAALAALTVYQQAHAALRIAEAKTREAQVALGAAQALSDSDEQQIEAKEAKLLVEGLEPLYVELEQRLLGSQDWVGALRAARNLRDTETRLQVAEHLCNDYWSTAPQAIHDALLTAVRTAQQQLNERRGESQSTAEQDAVEQRCRELELLTAQQQAELARLSAAAEKEQKGIRRLRRAVRRGEESAAAAAALLARAQQDMERLMDEYDAVAVARRRTIAEHAAALSLALP